jgi:hypothetical protein
MAEQQTPDRGPGYETRDLSVQAIGAFGIVLMLALIAAVGVTAWMFGFFETRAARQDAAAPPTAATRAAPQEPKLQVDAPKDLKALRAQEEQRLTTYGWTSQETGLGRIPIERAMELLVERGINPGGRP